MKNQNYRAGITVTATPEEAFGHINNVSDWWSQDFKGESKKLNDLFTVTFGETFITVKIVELVPYSKIGWQVIDCYKHWLKNKMEWKDTIMTWEIQTAGNATQINFTHVGLLPGIECYEGCEKAWDFYIKDSLFKLISKGKGIPEAA